MEPIASPSRRPAVAGQFYPASAAEIERTVRGMVADFGPAGKAMGVMVPHAGYIYSGAVAAEVFASVELPQTFIIIGPNHTGLGPPASIMVSGVWQMPAGDVPVDSGLADAIRSHSLILAADEAAHVYEHSLEVQLPFLQLLAGEVSIVPICLMGGDTGECRAIGIAIARAVKEWSRPVLIVASSDMTHYESQDVAAAKDRLALERILELDADGLLETVREHHVTMCGYAPAAVMLNACRELGATTARLTRYATSGDVTGDDSQVVGYAGVIVS